MFQLVVLLDFDLFGGYGRFDEMGINCFYEISVLVFRISPTGYVPIRCSTLILTSMVDMLDLMKWVSIVSKNFRFLSFEYLPMDMVQLVVLLDLDFYGEYERFDEMGFNFFNEISVFVFRIRPTGYVSVGKFHLILNCMVDTCDLIK